MDKTVVITGATSGFGAACAHAFAKLGWRLVLTGRRSEVLSRLQSELAALTAVHVITLDVREREAVLAAFASLPPEFAEVDLLVNNAGLALGLEPAHKASLDDWDTMVDTNIKGVMYCTRALLPGMVARNRGHVVNIGSVAGAGPTPAAMSTERARPSCSSSPATCAPTCWGALCGSPTSPPAWPRPSSPRSASRGR